VTSFVPHVPLVRERDAMAAKLERAQSPAPLATTELRSRTAPLRWFAAVPIALLKDPSVAAESKVVAGLLIAYDGPRGCFPKISSLMSDIGVSKHTIIRCLEELERYGFLTREKRGRNNLYHLTPAYVQPARPDDIILTGELAVENARPTKPVRRKTLHNRRPDPTLPLSVEPVAPVQPIPISRAKRGPKQVAPVQPIDADEVTAKGSTGATQTGDNPAELVAPEQPGLVAPVQPVRPNRLHRSNLDITKNQTITNNQQQLEDAAAGASTTKAAVELTLINAGVAPDDAVRWAGDLVGLPLADIAEALRIMRAKPAYRRREIDRPGAYMRTLCATAVPMERELGQHYARGERSAEIRRLEATRERSDYGPPAADDAPEGTERTAIAPPVAHRVALEAPRDETPDIDDVLEHLDALQRAAVTQRALQIVRAGPTSPAWRGALTMALRQCGFAE